MTMDKMLVFRRIAGVVAGVAAALWGAVQAGVLHYGPRFSTIVASVAIGGAALAPSLLPRPVGDEKPKKETP